MDINITVEEYLFSHVEKSPDKTAVITVEGRLSYSDLFKKAVCYGAFLRENGIKKGDIIVTRASNTLDFSVLYLGVHFAGAVICSLEKSTPAASVAEIAAKMGASLILADDITASDTPIKVLPRTIMEDADAAEYPAEVIFPKPDDSADILFTTGTTGASKGVELSHRALTAAAENLFVGCGYQEDMLLVVPGPLNHANAIRKLFASLIMGCTVYILNGMTNVRSFFDALDEPYPTVACCLPPAMMRLLLTVAKDKLGEYKDRISFIECASAPLPDSDKVRISELLPNTRLMIAYGLSEAASVLMYDCTAHPGLVNCIGKPTPNSEILIVDDDHHVIRSSKDHTGLIAIRGPVNMERYVNAPDLTKEVLEDGIFFTNDIGYIDEEGYVYTIGRKGDVINVGGLKVAPTEVEDAVLTHPEIKDCICIAREDPISGHVPALLYVADREIPPRELSAYLSKRLEAFKVPKKYTRTDQINRTYNGKLDRKSYQ